MAHASSPQPSLMDRNHFLLRRLHSLSGLIPVGAFLIEHLLTNSRAFGWFGGGKESFNKAVHGIHELPYLLLIEIMFIFAPLAFHAGYGIWIAKSGQRNSNQYPYMGNRRYTLQRVTAYITLLFIVVHLLKFRFAHLVGWTNGWPEANAAAGYVGAADPFELTRLGFQNFFVSMPVVAAFYAIGLTAAVFHFCNGLWTLCITWGITVGEQAQRKVGMACSGLAMVLLLWGGLSIYTFSTAKPPARSDSHAASAAPSAEIGTVSEARSH